MESRMFSIVKTTWNPVTGCEHNCVYCWARRLVNSKLKKFRKYKRGFTPQIHYYEFNRRFQRGDVVFVSDMGDLFGDFIPDDWIMKVIEYVRRFPKTNFLFLTKNPKRYHYFDFPSNVILGATIETNRDDLYKEYSISKAPLPSERYKAMRDLQWDKKLISIEPVLDFDVEIFKEWLREINPIIVYVGYDNYNNKLPEPLLSKTLKLIDVLNDYTVVFKKTLRFAWYEC